VKRFEEGDHVRADITDRDDPDFRYHRMKGEIVEINQDDAALVTGDDRDSYVYRVELESGETVDLRWRDLRPVRDI